MGGQQLHVLIITSDMQLRGDLIEVLLSQDICQVDVAVSLREAWTLLTGPAAKYSLIFIDNMQASEPCDVLGSNNETASQIKSRSPQSSIIILGDNSESSPSVTPEHNTFHRLAKPIEKSELLALLHRTINLSSMDRDRSIYESLLRIGSLSSEQDSEKIFAEVVRGVQVIGFDRVRLYLLSDDNQVLVCKAHVGADESLARHQILVARPYFTRSFSTPFPLRVRNRQDSDQDPFEGLLVGETIKEWLIIPLILKGGLIGVIVADNKEPSQIAEEGLSAIPLFVSQAVMAVANTNLEKRARSLNTVVRLSTEASSSLDLDKILRAPCQAAVELFKVDHSGLMLFDSNHENGYVVAEYPAIGTKGLTIPLRGVPAEEQMINFQQPIVIRDISQDKSFNPVRDILLSHKIHSVVVVPIINKGRLLGSLGLDIIGQEREFTSDEIEICKGLAAQAAVAIENAQLYEQNKYKAEQLEAIRSTTLALTSYKDLKSILDTIIKQAVNLLDAKDGGIYQFNPDRGELTVIADYGFPQFIGTTLKVGEGLVGRVAQDGLPFMAVTNYDAWPGKTPTCAKTKRFGSVLGVSLKLQGRTIGVLYINDTQGREYPSELPHLLSLFASTAAIAIDNAHLLHEAEVARERIRSSYEASSALASIRDSKTVLQDMVNYMLEAAEASWVRLVLFDNAGENYNFIAQRNGRIIAEQAGIRDDGISMRVLQTGEMFSIEDTQKALIDLNPTMIEEGCRAALCLPLSHLGRPVGVMWIHYDEPRRFNDADTAALMIYVKQATIAYDSARQMEELEPLRVAAEGLASATGTEEVLERIVASARQVLKADTAVVWLAIDSEIPPELLVREAVASGIDKGLLDELSSVAVPAGEVTHRVMKVGWFSIPDIAAEMTGALSSITASVLKRIGAMSFQGLALVVADEKLGVLYLIYRRRRAFDPDDERAARTFAAHAALALKKAKLVDQVQKAQTAVQEVEKFTALGDLWPTLRNIVKSTKETIGCDAITLFIYDEGNDRLAPYTTMYGVRVEQKVMDCESAPRDSIVYKMLFQEESYYSVPRVVNDPLFRERPFVVREQIESVCAIPLKFKQHRVGVMFVNYRTSHTFTKAELDTTLLFANYAAVAIRNALLYREQKKRLREQRSLVKLSQEFLAATDMEEAMQLAVHNAAESLETDFCAIALQESDGQLKIVAVEGWSEELIGTLEISPAREFQTAFTIRVGEPVFVEDYEREWRFRTPEFVTDEGVKSGLSVPMYSGEKLVGAMLVHSLRKRRFTQSEGTLLSLIANQTAIAIQQHQVLKSKKASLMAIQSATDELSRIRLGVDQKEVLDKIVEQAVKCFPQAFFGTIQLYDEAKNELRFESVSPSWMLEELVNKQRQTKRKIVRRPDLPPIGIAGRVVLSKRPQRVDDVQHDPDYFEFSELTKSELAVPLLAEDQSVLGVLNVESEVTAAFDEEDEQTLIALAKLAVTTIQNAEQYRLLEASTLLAWFGMASSIWGHAVAGDALNIRDNVMLLRKELKDQSLAAGLREMIETKLQVIEEMALHIREKPITALLSYDKNLSDTHLNDLLQRRIGQLWRNPPYRAIPYRLELTKTAPEPIVRCSPDWLKRMLEILLNNAVVAMKQSVDPLLTISTKMIDSMVELTITDTGPGIPPDLVPKLFKQQIEKPSSSKGLGTGLLMARAIVQTYKGEIGVAKTSQEGTTMYVRLPIVEPK
jgi:GAF domain-containing protein